MAVADRPQVAQGSPGAFPVGLRWWVPPALGLWGLLPEEERQAPFRAEQVRGPSPEEELQAPFPAQHLAAPQSGRVYQCFPGQS